MKTFAIAAGVVIVVALGVWAFASGIPGLSREATSTSTPASLTTSSTTSAATSSEPAQSTSMPSGSGVHQAPVPGPKPAPQDTSGIRGTVTIGPTCPVQKDPPDPNCTDRPYQTTLVIASTIVGRNGGVLVQTDAQGRFEHSLPAGTYTIRSTGNGAPPTLQPMTVTVKDGAWTTVTVQFDSGIR